jgi:hypothetical protein
VTVTGVRWTILLAGTCCIGAVLIVLSCLSSSGPTPNDVATDPGSKLRTVGVTPPRVERRRATTNVTDTKELPVKMAGPARAASIDVDPGMFAVGEDWIGHLRDVKRKSGVAGVICAMKVWVQALKGFDGEPTRSSVLFGAVIAEQASGQLEDAAGDLLDAVCFMTPEQGALRARWEQGQTWPTLGCLIPIPRESAVSGSVPGASSLKTTWCKDLKILSWSPDQTLGRWLLGLSSDESNPELAMAASTLWHVLLFTGDLDAIPSASPAWAWRQEESPRGDAARNAWLVEEKGKSTRESARLVDIRASLRAEVLGRFTDLHSAKADRIRSVVGALLGESADALNASRGPK